MANVKKKLSAVKKKAKSSYHFGGLKKVKLNSKDVYVFAKCIEGGSGVRTLPVGPSPG